MMVRSLLAILAVFLCRPGAAQAQCAPSDEAGWVARVEYALPARRDAPSPVIVRGRANLDVVEGEPLCVNDLVRNPLGSVKRVRLRVAGFGSPEVRAGGEYLVRASASAGLGSFLEPFNRYLTRVHRQARGVVPSRTRGVAQDPCRFSPARQELMANVVPAWGPIYLSWQCRENRSGPWNVVVTSGSAHSAVLAYANIVRLDPRLCQGFCLVTVTHFATNEEVLTMHLQVASPASAPLPALLRNLPMNAARRAAAGAWITTRRVPPDWQLQGMSLLWDTGCDFPAAGQMAAQIYGASSPEEVCDGRE